MGLCPTFEIPLDDPLYFLGHKHLPLQEASNDILTVQDDPTARSGWEKILRHLGSQKNATESLNHVIPRVQGTSAGARNPKPEPP